MNVYLCLFSVQRQLTTNEPNDNKKTMKTWKKPRTIHVFYATAKAVRCIELHTGRTEIEMEEEKEYERKSNTFRCRLDSFVHIKIVLKKYTQSMTWNKNEMK